MGCCRSAPKQELYDYVRRKVAETAEARRQARLQRYHDLQRARRELLRHLTSRADACIRETLETTPTADSCVLLRDLRGHIDGFRVYELLFGIMLELSESLKPFRVVAESDYVGRESPPRLLVVFPRV